MFYVESSNAVPTLRFGDVVKDFPICFPVVSSPSLLVPYHIQVYATTYSIVLSPCCSISDKTLSIAPLIPLPNSLFSNPYFADNPIVINKKIPADKSLPPVAWERMDPAEKAERLAKPEAYVFVDHFIYDEHDLFQEYDINRKEGKIRSRLYAVDFRTAVRIHCDKITNPTFQPGGTKVLQLSVETRQLLRNKIGSFYQRIPDEDLGELAI